MKSHKSRLTRIKKRGKRGARLKGKEERERERGKVLVVVVVRGGGVLAEATPGRSDLHARIQN